MDCCIEVGGVCVLAVCVEGILGVDGGCVTDDDGGVADGGVVV